MREIKFRALKNGVWYTLEFVGSGLRWENKLLQMMTDEFTQFEAFVQFTGLKDKNGKEIYEGDILTNHWNVAGGGKFIGNNWEIKFGEASDYDIESGSQWIGFYCENDKGEISNTFLPSNSQSEKDRYEVESGIEVIGNIHENPDLLKAK